MPYPVPPPTPPPVVDYLSPEETLSSPIPTPAEPPSAGSASVSSNQESVHQVSLSPTPVMVCAPERSLSCGTFVSEQDGSVFDAKALGTPLQVNVSGLLSEPEDQTLSNGHLISDEIYAPANALSSPTAPEVIPVSRPNATLQPLVTTRPAPVASFVALPLNSSHPSSKFHTSSEVPELDRLVQRTTDPTPSPINIPVYPARDEDVVLPATTDDLPEDAEGLTEEAGEILPEDSGEVLIIPGQGEAPVIPDPPPDESLPGSVPSTQEEVQPSDETVPAGTPPMDFVVELIADRQEYDTLNQIFFAEGNVEMRFRRAVLLADRLRVNIPNRIAVAEGNVVLTRGNQVLRGTRFVYNFVQEQGRVYNGSGEVFIPAASVDLADAPPDQALPNDVSAGLLGTQPFSNFDVIIAEQPLTTVYSLGGFSITAGGGGRTGNTETNAGTTGSVNRFRFEADQIDFTADGWDASNVRVTNDPFSPPELEIRSRYVTFRELSPTLSEIRARNPRLVFDQGFSLPLLRERYLIDQRERESGLVGFGFDEEDRGGFYIERSFPVFSRPWLAVTLTPQLLAQRAIDEDGFFDASSYGLVAELEGTITPSTTFRGNLNFSSLNLSDVDDNLRASLRLQQGIGLPWGTHSLNLEYSYRDRLFNGSLGYQDVEESLGLVFLSPSILLGDTGINFSYQLGYQAINARTDVSELLPEIRVEDDDYLVDLDRFQASAALSRSFLLWYGQPLEPTPEAAFRYSPNPIVPYIAFNTGLTGVFGSYSNGDTQSAITATVGLQGQFGHFSRDFLDYTAFNVTYSQVFQDGESPFLFDRVADQQILSFGIVQQLYGPFRVGFQTVINAEDSNEIDTVYSLEYARRAYSILLQFSPTRETGSLTFRINDFNWSGRPEPFSGTEANLEDSDSGTEANPEDSEGEAPLNEDASTEASPDENSPTDDSLRDASPDEGSLNEDSLDMDSLDNSPSGGFLNEGYLDEISPEGDTLDDSFLDNSFLGEGSLNSES